MPKNDGKPLEWLISLIEGHAAPSGFSVETRKPVFEDGVQIAELDIVVTGRVGTAPFKGLIECRDRPSEGAAPAAWIEQFFGCRRRFNFTSVMAVSTTGFAPGAVTLTRLRLRPTRCRWLRSCLWRGMLRHPQWDREAVG